ncbi:MAG: response regulator [Planctomycetes bacterium]|nr:response regulator [Planctomycetota bacterium]
MTYLLLHVDDHPGDLELLRNAMLETDPDVQVESVASAAAALTFLTADLPTGGQRCPDLVMIDINMPLISGIQLLRLLKESPQWQKLPALMFSSSQRSVERAVCKQLGAAGFMRKPAHWTDYLTFTRKLAAEIRSGRLREMQRTDDSSTYSALPVAD